MTNAEKASAVTTLWRQYADLPIRTQFMERALKDEQFYYGNQWTKKQIDEITVNGFWPVVKNRLMPAANQLISELAAQAPKGKIIATTAGAINADVMLNAVLSHIEYISNRYVPTSRCAHDLTVRGGLGWLMPVVDTLSSDGMGDIIIEHIPNDSVFVSPTVSKIPTLNDAPAVFIGKDEPLEFAIRKHPKLKKQLEEATSFDSMPIYAQERKIDGTELIIGTNKQFQQNDDDFKSVFKIEKYELIRRKRWQVTNTYTGQSYITYDSNLSVIENVGMFFGRIQKKEMPPVQRCRVTHLYASDVWVGQEWLELENYPMVPFIATDTGNLFPVDLISFVIDEQMVLNKHEMMRLRYIQEATHGKLVIPKDMDEEDKEELKSNYAKLGVPIEIEFNDDGTPPFVHVQPAMIPGAYILDADRAERGITDGIGMFPPELGSPEGAHRTFRGIISLREQGKSKRRNTLEMFNLSYQQLYNNIIQLIPSVYNEERVMVYLDEDHVPVELQINKKEFVDNTWQTVSRIVQNDGKQEMVGNIADIKAQYRIIWDSFLPNDRFAMAQLMGEILQQTGGNNVFLKEMIKFLDLPNRAKLIAEIDENEQLKSMLKQQQTLMQGLKINADKANREKTNAMIEADATKSKTSMDITKMKQQFEGKEILDEFQKDKEIEFNDYQNELKLRLKDFEVQLAKKLVNRKDSSNA